MAGKPREGRSIAESADNVRRVRGGNPFLYRGGNPFLYH